VLSARDQIKIKVDFYHVFPAALLCFLLVDELNVGNWTILSRIHTDRIGNADLIRAFVIACGAFIF
jgi:hypothetical protein